MRGRRVDWVVNGCDVGVCGEREDRQPEAWKTNRQGANGNKFGIFVFGTSIRRKNVRPDSW